MNNTFTAEIWIHADFLSSEPSHYEPIAITGYRVPVDLVCYMANADHNIEWLAGLPVEEVLRVQFTATEIVRSFNPYTGEYTPEEQYELTLVGWLVVPTPDGDVDLQQLFDVVADCPF